jgi:endonuclease/exonuclease/phosphatase family metal-dependent hydrolase
MEASAPEENRTKPSHDIPDNLARDMDRDALSQLVRDANGGGWGVSYQEMADRAERAGYQLSKPYFQKMATNAVTTAPSPERLRAIAAGLAKPLAVVQRAAAIQYLDYQATELAGYDDDIRVIVAHLAGMEKSERRRWQAMIEADERAKREDD